MITLLIISAALLAGYLVTDVCMLAATFGLTAASPAFVVQDYKITAKYKRVQALVWLVSVAIGSFVACAIGQTTYPMIVAAAFAACIVTLLWLNTWEARQRGMAHQILMSLTSLIGSAAGYGLAVLLLEV